MSDKFEDRGRKDGVSGPSQDHNPQPEGHQQQQVEGAAAQPNVHLLNQENPAHHPAAAPPPPPAGGAAAAAAAAAPVQENVVHHQPIPGHQDPINPRPIFIKKGDGLSAAIASKRGKVNTETSSKRCGDHPQFQSEVEDNFSQFQAEVQADNFSQFQAGVQADNFSQFQAEVQADNFSQFQAEVQADTFSFGSKNSQPPPEITTTDENPTYDVDEEEKCKRDSITKSSTKRPDDDQDPPGL